MSAEAERWREVCAALDVDLEYLPSVREAGDALAAALEARDREHDAAIGRMVGEIEARDRRIERLQERLEDAENANEAWSVGAERTRKHIAELQSLVKGYAFTLEARDRRIAELEAGLRRIENQTRTPAMPMDTLRLTVRHIARDLLAGRAAGGEGDPYLRGTPYECGEGLP